MNQLVSLQFTWLHKCLATLRTDVDPGPVSVQMFPHSGVVSEHLAAAFVRAGDGSGDLVKSLFLRFDPANIKCSMIWSGRQKQDSRLITVQNPPTVWGLRDLALVFLLRGSSSPSCTPCSRGPPRRRIPPRPPPECHPSCPLGVEDGVNNGVNDNIWLWSEGRCWVWAGSQWPHWLARPGPTPRLPHLTSYLQISFSAMLPEPPPLYNGGLFNMSAPTSHH